MGTGLGIGVAWNHIHGPFVASDLRQGFVWSKVGKTSYLDRKAVRISAPTGHLAWPHSVRVHHTCPTLVIWAQCSPYFRNPACLRVAPKKIVVVHALYKSSYLSRE